MKSEGLEVKNKKSGEITIETAIVFPIVMMMVLLLIYFAMFLHDIVKMKSYAYGAGAMYSDMEFKKFETSIRNKMKTTPLFITKINTKCDEEAGYYKITVVYKSKSNVKWMEELINKGNKSYEINIENKIPRNILNITSAIKDNVRKGDDN